MTIFVKVDIEKFLDGFDGSEHQRLDDDRGSWRQVYAVDENYQNELGFEDSLVVKYSENLTAKSQNRTELTSYLETLERGQDFIPQVFAGTTDFEYLVTLKVNPLPEPRTGHPWRENPELEQRAQQRREVLPEGWSDNDEIELGVLDGEHKLMDAGTLIRSDWIVGDPLEHDSLNLTVYDGVQYFHVEP